MRKTVYIDIGHSPTKEGARNVLDGRCENAWWRDGGAKGVEDALHARGYLTVTGDRSGYRNSISTQIKNINKLPDIACAVSLHYNDAENPYATGTEVLYAEGMEESSVLACFVQRHMMLHLGLPSRGAKGIPKHVNGGTWCWQTAMPAILVEPFFGSSIRDCKTVQERGGAYALGKAIGIAIAEYLDRR